MSYESKDAEFEEGKVGKSEESVRRAAEETVQRFGTVCASSTAAQQEARRRRTELARGKGGAAAELENEAAALIEWERDFDGGEGGYDDTEGGLESSLRTNKATAGTLSTRTFDDIDSAGEEDAEARLQAAERQEWQDEALPPMSVEEAYDTVKRYTRTPEFLSPFVEHIRKYIGSFSAYLEREGLQDATLAEACQSEKPHEWYASFREYNGLFEAQIRQILFVCGISNEDFFELVESKASGKVPSALDDAAFIATVKATLDFDDYVRVMIDEAKSRRFTVKKATSAAKIESAKKAHDIAETAREEVSVSAGSVDRSHK